MKKVIFLFVIFLIAFTTCKKDPAAEEKPKNPAVDYIEYSNEGIIGAGGGKVLVTETTNSIKNAFVEIPAGTLSNEAKISIKASSKKNWFEGSENKLFISIEPSGVEFSKPVKIGLPYKNEDDADKVKVFYFDDNQKVWIPPSTLSIDKTNRIIVSETNHFSEYVATESKMAWESSLYFSNNTISAKIKLNTPLKNISVSAATLLKYLKPNIRDMLSVVDADVRAIFYVTLNEKNLIGAKQLETVEVKYRIKTMAVAPSDAYIVWGEDRNNNMIFESGPDFVSVDGVEKIYSGEPILFQFKNTMVNAGSKYYIDCRLYYQDKNAYDGGLWTYTGLFFSGRDNASIISGMGAPPDKDKDGIIDAYDKVDGNPPKIPAIVDPADNITGIALSTTLTWDCSDPDNDPLTYDIYFGTANPPTTKVGADQPSKTLVRSGLAYSTPYYWQVIAKDSKGNSTPGPVWRFTTVASPNKAPEIPSNPYPENGAVDIPMSTTLSWNCSDPDGDQLTYDVYFGTTTNPNTKVSSDQVAKTLSRNGLANNTPYYWQVIAKDSKGNSTPGPIWKFTTQNNIGGNNQTGSFTDTRGGETKVYKTVKIGNQWWFAENLAYLPSLSPTEVSSTTIPSYYVYGYYGTDIAGAKATPEYSQYGVLYNWEAAKISCPPGWHLPSDDEWKQMEMALGMTQTEADRANWWRGTDQGTQLKASYSWNFNYNGTNSSNFSALAAGNYSGIATFNFFHFLGSEASWWCSNQYDNLYSWYRNLFYNDGKIFRYNRLKADGLSVRCVKDSQGTAPVTDFTTSKTSIKKGEAIQFTDISTNAPTSWLWDFGDGTTSAAQNPTKTYSAVGTYTVSLKATNNFGINTKTLIITVAETGTGGTGTFTDPRDNKTYITVKIGNQEWMAENLAYLPSVSPPSSGSNTAPYYYVYGFNGSDVATAKQQANYTTYGVLYNWPAALAACPSGWHLPSDAEWKQLEMALGMSQAEADVIGLRGTDQGTQMKATSGWNSNENGTNTSGFAALPAGGRYYDGAFYYVGGQGVWWSSTEGDTSSAWVRSVNYSGQYVYRGNGYKKHGFSVRCVRD